MSSRRKGLPQAAILLVSAFIILIIAVYLFYADTTIYPPIENTPISNPRNASALRLTVTQSGIVALSDTMIKNGGLRISSFSEKGMRLSQGERDVPFLVLEEGNKKSLYFYADHPNNELFSAYLLESKKGKGMQVSNGIGTEKGEEIGEKRHHWETRELFFPNVRAADSWFSGQILPSNPFKLALSEIKPLRGQAAMLTLSLWSVNDTFHQVDVRINQRLIETITWQGSGVYTKTITIPAMTFDNTKNQLDLRFSDNTPKQTAVEVDWVELRYTASLIIPKEGQLSFYSDARTLQLSGNSSIYPNYIFDVSNSANPIFLQLPDEKNEFAHVNGSEFNLINHYIALNSSNVMRPKIDPVPIIENSLNTEDGADYIAILAPIPGIEKAIEPLLQARRAEGLDVLAIPAQQIYYEIGRGIADANTVQKFISYAMTWEKKPRYILLVGDGNDGEQDNWSAPWLPTLLEIGRNGLIANDQGLSAGGIAIGRWPVRNLADVETLVTKTLSFATTPPLTRTLFIQEPPTSFVTNLLKQNQYTITTIPLNAPTIIDTLQEGVRLWNYAGKGDRLAWGDERFWSVTNLASLSNPTHPILVVLSAPTGYFFHPQENSLAEELLWQPSGGIVAAIASSGNVSADLVQQATQTFYTYLLEGETIGTAWRQTRASYSDLSLSAINVLGDPALRLPITK